MATVTKAASSAIDGTTGAGQTDLGQWVNESNAFATTGDNVYATAVLGTAKKTERASMFGFPAFTTGDIPNGATINSVTVTVEWGMTVAVTGSILGAQLHNPAGTVLGTETTKTTATEEQSTQQVTSGITLTDLRSAGIVVANVRYGKGNVTTDTTGNLDFVSLTVDYTAAADARLTVSFFEFEIPAAAGGTTLSPASLSHTRAQGAPTAVLLVSPVALTHTRAQGVLVANTTIPVAALVHTRSLGAPLILVLQFVRPDADLAAAGWTPFPASPTTLFDKVSDESASSYITATAS